MKTSKGIRQLINDARTAGRFVIESDLRCVIRFGRSNKSRGLTIWPNGRATRTDVDLTVSQALRHVRSLTATSSSAAFFGASSCLANYYDIRALRDVRTMRKFLEL